MSLRRDLQAILNVATTTATFSGWVGDTTAASAIAADDAAGRLAWRSAGQRARAGLRALAAGDEAMALVFLRDAEGLAAAALARQTHEADRDRKAQARSAASQPRRSKWDSFRDGLADDLAEVMAGAEDSADVLEAELRQLWLGRGETAFPPRSTVVKWVQAWLRALRHGNRNH